MTKTWQMLEALFRESKQYRGDNSVRLVDLEKLMASIADKGEFKGGSGVHLQKTDKGFQAHVDPKGGSISCQYGFDPKIWGKWFSSQDLALSMAAMDKDVTAQYAGRSQGHTVHKTNWGGRVLNSPGKPRNDFERLPSAMDRYDVLMQGEVTTKIKRSKSGELEEVPVGNLLRIAYSPSIGSTEERKARLLALISGQATPELRRRVQPHIPEPSKDDAQHAMNQPAPPVPRVGQNMKKARTSDDDVDDALKSLERK